MQKLAPFLVAAVALAFIAIGIARPPWLWDLGRVRTGRAIFGEGGTRAFFVGLGVVLLGVAIAAYRRRRRG